MKTDDFAVYESGVLNTIFPGVDVPAISTQGEIVQCSENFKKPKSCIFASLSMLNVKDDDSIIRKRQNNYSLFGWDARRKALLSKNIAACLYLQSCICTNNKTFEPMCFGWMRQKRGEGWL